MQVTFLFKLGLGLGHGLRSGPLLLLIKNLYSDRQRVGKTLVYASNGESVKKKWVDKSFIDDTYNDSRRESVKVFTDRRMVGKAAFTDPPSDVNNKPWCSDTG
jgi:hypothetical protein